MAPAKPPTPEQLWERMLAPFEEMDPVLSMSSEEIRAELTKDGYDVAAIEREAYAFLGLKPKRRWRLRIPMLATLVLPMTIIGSCVDVFGPAIPALPIFAKPAPSDMPVVTAAAAPPVDETTDAIDGGAQ